ncbi:MAG: CoA-binding protein [Polyangiaceae bacterium]
MTTRASIEAFVGTKHLALIGASRTKGKFGNTLLRELRKKGYMLKVIHPDAEAIEGEPCLRSLKEVAGTIDCALIVTSKQHVPDLLRQAEAAGIKQVWLQQGAESPEALVVGKELGLDVIAGQCILMHAAPTGAHAFHRCLVKLFGRLPS